MEKEVLYEFFKSRFLEAGFSAEETGLHLAHLKEKYESYDDDALEAEIRQKGGASKLAAQVVEYRNTVLMKEDEYRAFAKGDFGGQETQSGEAETQTEALKKELSRFEKITSGESGAPSQNGKSDVELLLSTDAEDDDIKEFSGGKTKDTAQKRTAPDMAAQEDTQPGSEDGEDLEKTRTISVAKHMVSQHRQEILRESADPSGEEYEETPVRRNRLAEKTYWGEGSEESFRKFWILFAVTFPLTLGFILFLFALAVAVMGVLITGMVGLFLALIGEVALGSAISLIGIIYGVSQIFVTQPVGLFETGIGVTVVGVTMFVGILLYNLAIRFFPFLLKQFSRFIRFVRHHIVDIFYYLKGECYRR